MSVNILYKNIDFFSNHELPTPSVERSSEIINFGENRGTKEIVTLIGSVYKKNVEECDYFSNLIHLRDQLLTFFSDDYNSLEIQENGQSIYNRDFCKIEDVSFEGSEYKKVLNFKITISCYDEDLHNEFFGINSPQNRQEINFSDGLYRITRELSAVGENLQDSNSLINTKNSTNYSSGMENAISFVKSLKNSDNIIIPKEHPELKFYLVNESETIDRIKNFYSVTQEYLADTFDNQENHGVLRYVIEQSDNFAAIKTARINGTLQFSKYQDISLLRSRYDEIDFYDLLTTKLGTTIYSKMPVALNVTENLESKNISFNIIYDNNDAYDDCGVAHHNNFSITEDGGYVNVSMSGTVYARGPIERRWDFVKKKFYSQSGYIEDARSACQAELDLHYGSGVMTINSVPETENITENKLAANINYSYNFTNKYVPDGFISFNIAASMNFPVDQLSIDMNYGKPSGADGRFILTDSGKKSPVINISANGIYDTDYDCSDCDCFSSNECKEWCCQGEVLKFSPRKRAEYTINQEINNKFSEFESLITKSRNIGPMNSSIEVAKNLSHEENENIVSMNISKQYFTTAYTSD